MKVKRIEAAVLASGVLAAAGGGFTGYLQAQADVDPVRKWEGHAQKCAEILGHRAVSEALPVPCTRMVRADKEPLILPDPAPDPLPAIEAANEIARVDGKVAENKIRQEISNGIAGGRNIWLFLLVVTGVGIAISKNTEETSE